MGGFELGFFGELSSADSNLDALRCFLIRPRPANEACSVARAQLYPFGITSHTQGPQASLIPNRGGGLL